MSFIVKGKAYYCGDFVDTDVMAPGRFEPVPNWEALAKNALVDYVSKIPFVNPETGRSDYTVIFAGSEFGCGSSRDTAPRALQQAGAKIVIARSFGRIFFRNCVNMGLLVPITCDHPFDEKIIDKEVSVDLEGHTFTAEGQNFSFPDFGPLTNIIRAGGILPYVKAQAAGGSR